MGLRESLAGAQCEGFPQLWTVFGDLSLCLCLCQSFTTLSPLIFEVGSFSRGCLSQPWSLPTGWSSTPPHVVARNGSQSSSVAQSCPTLCDPVNRSTPGLPVHHQRPEFTQTHLHRVGDAIQPSHPLSSPSPPAPNPSQHQSLFQ